MRKEVVQKWLVSVTHSSELTIAMAVVSSTVLQYGGGAGPNMSPAHTRARALTASPKLLLRKEGVQGWLVNVTQV